MKFQAIGSVRQYDKLVSKHPPKPEQRVDGASFEHRHLRPGADRRLQRWSERSTAATPRRSGTPGLVSGALMVLFRNAVELNNRGLDIPFNGNTRCDSNFALEMAYCHEKGRAALEVPDWHPEDGRR